MKKSKTSKPTARDNSDTRRIPKSNKVRRVVKKTTLENTKGFREWQRTGKVDLNLVPTDMKPKQDLRKAAMRRLKGK